MTVTLKFARGGIPSGLKNVTVTVKRRGSKSNQLVVRLGRSWINTDVMIPDARISRQQLSICMEPETEQIFLQILSKIVSIVVNGKTYLGHYDVIDLNDKDDILFLQAANIWFSVEIERAISDAALLNVCLQPLLVD